MEKITIEAEDGYRLGALFGNPTATPRGTVIISAATGIKKEFDKCQDNSIPSSIL